MKIGGRVGFERLDELARNFSGIDFPIELALPWRYLELWKPMEHRLDEVKTFFKESGLNILSIHATQGRISEDSFLDWGRKTLELARYLGIRDITLHPDNRKTRRLDHQKAALERLRRLEDEMDMEGVFSIETFGGYNRIMSPREIIELGLPMTLDTAHIHDQAEIMAIIERYHRCIKTVHLSAIGADEHHLPLDPFCLSVVDRFKELDWKGNVILEYLPWFHYRVRPDVQALRDHVEHGIPYAFTPNDDRYRNQPDRWGYGPDGRIQI